MKQDPSPESLTGEESWVKRHKDKEKRSYPITITMKPIKDRYAQSKVIGDGRKESGRSKSRKRNVSSENEHKQEWKE
jgi:hypothetical protein